MLIKQKPMPLTFTCQHCPTFIMRRMVLRTMRSMMKYSKGLDTTTRHSLYLKLSLSFGMYRSSGRAWMEKSIHA